MPENPTNSLPSTNKLARFAALLLPLVLLIVLACQGWMKRPLEQDELETLKLFGPMGYDWTAETRPVGPLQLATGARGLGKVFFAFWNPNNHIVHSIAASAISGVVGFSEAGFRLAALLGWMGTVVVTFMLAMRITRSAFVSGLVATLTVTHPFFTYYGQTARGYSICSFLVGLQLLMLDRWYGKRLSTRDVLIYSGLTILGFANVISTLFMWIVPSLAVPLFVATYRQLRKTGEPGAVPGWLLASVSSGIFAVTFLVCNIRMILFSQQRWGLKFNSVATGSDLAAHVVTYLSPGIWAGITALGVVSWIILAKQRHWMGIIVLVSFGLTSAYILGGRTFPYPRTFGLFLPLLFLGIALLWTQLQARTSRLGAHVLLTGLAGFTLTTAVQAFHWKPQDTASAVAAAVTAEIRASKDNAALALLPSISGEEARYYYPSEASMLNPNLHQTGTANLYLACDVTQNSYRFRVQSPRPTEREFTFWTLRPDWNPELRTQFGSIGVVRVPGKLTPGRGEPGRCILAWTNNNNYFAAGRLIASRLAEKQADWEIPMLYVHYLSPPFLLIFCDGPEEFAKANAVLDALDHESGHVGNVLRFTPGASSN